MSTSILHYYGCTTAGSLVVNISICLSTCTTMDIVYISIGNFLRQTKKAGTQSKHREAVLNCAAIKRLRRRDSISFSLILPGFSYNIFAISGILNSRTYGLDRMSAPFVVHVPCSHANAMEIDII